MTEQLTLSHYVVLYKYPVQSTELESVNVTSVEKIVFDKMERYRAVFMKLMKTF